MALETVYEELIKDFRVEGDGRLVGCCFHKASGKWRASIKINKKLISLGLFLTEQEAHQVYLKACGLIEEYVDNKQFRNLLKGGENMKGCRFAEHSSKYESQIRIGGQYD